MNRCQVIRATPPRRPRARRSGIAASALVLLMGGGLAVPMVARPSPVNAGPRVTDSSPDETLLLKDGSRLRGRLTAIYGDTLVFVTTFGAKLKIARDRVARLEFVPGVADSGEGAGTPTTSEYGPKGGDVRIGRGFVHIGFESSEVSSKVVIGRGADEVAAIEANAIVEYLLADGDTVFTTSDTDMDKTIYRGHEKIVKNTAVLKPVTVELDAGLHHCVLGIRNDAPDGQDVVFDADPLSLTLNLDNVQVFPGKTTRYVVKLAKGKLRMGRLRLERVD